MIQAEFVSKLAALPPLGVDHAQHSCKICGKKSAAFDAVDFNKCCSEQNFMKYGISGVQIPYLRCECCGFVFTEFFDAWSADDFSKYVYNQDYVEVDAEYADIRPTRLAELASKLLASCQAARILDYGSGTGIFSQRLAALGFRSVTNYDPFSSPKRPAGNYDIITCFEVIEHSPAPDETMKDILSFLAPGGTVFFGTSVQPQNIDLLRGSWWYIAPRNGHVSIYNHESLALLGQKFGLILHQGNEFLAFRPAEPALFKAPVGQPFLCRMLCAPPATDDPQADANLRAAGWLPAENGFNGAFRWTSQAEIVWQVDVPPMATGRLCVLLPFIMHVTPEFVAECRFVAGGKTIPAIFSRGRLSAIIPLDPGFDGTVKLQTPPPVSPASLGRGADDRLLGVAIRC